VNVISYRDGLGKTGANVGCAVGGAAEIDAEIWDGEIKACKNRTSSQGHENIFVVEREKPNTQECAVVNDVMGVWEIKGARKMLKIAQCQSEKQMRLKCVNEKASRICSGRGKMWSGVFYWFGPNAFLC
jgi:hypothetical protein